MIDIVQVFRYQTNNGCSVRIGRGISHEQPLERKECIAYEFVESREEAKFMLNIIKRLPVRFRGRDKSILMLQDYLKTGKKSSLDLNMFTLEYF